MLHPDLPSTPAPTTADAFAEAPESWFHLASIAELSKGPASFGLPGGETFAGFLGKGGVPVVLRARCSHMGADLARGCVREGRIVCPLHGWEYGADGKCEHIPASAEIPERARQDAFPVAVRGGHVFFYNGATARFPMPFFDGVNPDELRPAQPFDICDEVPWQLVGANGFDRQHFEMTHDRRLLSEPVVEEPHPFARRSVLDLEISGTSIADCITRTLAGPRSRMTVTSWCGSLIFATAELRSARTFGLVSVRPLANLASHARIIVWVRRSRSAAGRMLLDPLNAIVRRRFILGFFQADLGRLTGTRYERARMIPADKMLVDYLDWLQTVHRT